MVQFCHCLVTSVLSERLCMLQCWNFEKSCERFRAWAGCHPVTGWNYRRLQRPFRHQLFCCVFGGNVSESGSCSLAICKRLSKKAWLDV